MKLTKLETQEQLDKALEMSERESEFLLSEPLDDNLPERFKKVFDFLVENQNKYFQLCWYASKNYQELHINDQFDAMAGVRRTRELYPDETKEIEDPEYGGWQKAFNQGVLATTRLVMGLMNKSFEEYQEVPYSLEEAKQMDLYVNEKGIAGFIYEEWDDAIENFPELDT